MLLPSWRVWGTPSTLAKVHEFLFRDRRRRRGSQRARRVYADEGFKDVSFGGVLSYRFLERWSVVALRTYARLLGDANQFFGGALINYRF